MTLTQQLVVGLIRLYRITLSPILGAIAGPTCGCRFHPTCSAYALEAVRTHGVRHGIRLVLKRLSRCHPWGSGGFDPVPSPSPASPNGTGSSAPWPPSVPLTSAGGEVR